MSKQPKKPMIRNWLRRGLSGILSLALILALLPGTVLPVQAAHWAMPYAQKLVEWGVMRGDNGNLALDRAITRAEFVAMMNRAYGYKKLGEMPFPDVRTSDWYYQDINIAYNMGYFKGASGYALPKANLTREMAAVMLTRNMMLQENVGEGLQFSDNRALSEWSRGLVGAAADMGIIGGYSDGSFRPKQNITRGEVASMLVKAIGTMVNTEGEHALGDVYGNVTVNTAGVSLKNGTIAGNLYLTGGIDLGDVVLENVNVLGEIIVSGGGESHSSQSSVTLRNVTAKSMSVDSISGQFVTLRAEGITDIGTTTVRTNAYVDDSSLTGFGGLGLIVQDGGGLLQLAGNVREVWNKTPNSELQVVQGSANKITMDEHATNSSVLVDGDARVDALNLDVATKVTGEGDIKNLNVGAAGTAVEQLPDDITIRPGITSDINGSPMNSSQAAESSAEPRLLAGYPKVKNIAPNSAELVFSTNKAGTVYWAVTALSDGSVSEENLIEPPTYGGKILKSGSVKMASSNTEVKAPTLTGLTQDGSYYVSTVFVDNRGIHSPVKVTAFTTPDGTTPAFSEGPRMSRVTTEVAQVTGIPNKSCQLYYALLRKGASAPTTAELKANAVRGNLGYGVRDAVKNSSININVNNRQLDQETDYVVYLWLNDYDGAKSSRVYSVPFKTPDERAPIIVRTREGVATETTVEMNVTVDEASTVYWTIIPEGEQYEAAFEERDVGGKFDPDDKTLQIKIGMTSAKGNPLKAGNVKVSAAKVNTEVLIKPTGLNSAQTNTTSYVMYMVAKDAAGNCSKVEKVTVHTVDRTDPKLLRQEFTIPDSSDPSSPMASSGVRLVFSENIQGGATATESFRKLYEAVEKAVTDGDKKAEAEARTAWGEALHAYMPLCKGYIPAQGISVEEAPSCDSYRKPEGQNVVQPTKAVDNWVINYGYAEIEPTTDGTLKILFPTVKDANGNVLSTSALNLQSGATYHFEMKDIRDASMQLNELDIDRTKEPPAFTVAFGKVRLEWRSETEIQVDGSPVAIDYNFTVTPDNVSQMADDWYSDLLIGSDTSMTFTLYSRPANGNWSKVGLGQMKLENVGIQQNQWVYKSLAWWFNNPDNLDNPNSSVTFEDPKTADSDKLTATRPGKFAFVNKMAPMEYAIHVDVLGGQSDRSMWSGPVTMKIYAIAGTQKELSSTGSGAAKQGNNSTYEKWIGETADVKEVGYDVSHTSVRHLDMENPFPYQKAPKIQTRGGFPSIDAYDTTVDITVNLDATGRVYWMLIPLSGLKDDDKNVVDNTGTLTDAKVQTVTDYTPAALDAVKEIKDGKETEFTHAAPIPLKNVPIMYGDKAWSKGNSTMVVDELRVTSKLVNDDEMWKLITGEAAVSFAGVQYGQVPTQTNQWLTIWDKPTFTIQDLEPNKVYLLCMITENDSNVFDKTAYCYRFTTEVASRPYFDLAGAGSMVTAKTEEKGTVNMHFLVMQGTQGRFTEKFAPNWAQTGWESAGVGVNSDGYVFTFPRGVTAATMTVLDAMTTTCERVNERGDREYVGSVFDVFATPTAVSTFASIIKSTMSGNVYIWSTATRGAPYTITGSTNQFNCETRRGPNDRTSCVGTDMNPIFTYTFVAVAEPTDGKSSQMSFRAWSPLSVSDNEAPKLRNYGVTSYEYSNGNLISAELYVDFNEPLYAYYKDARNNDIRHPIDKCAMATYMGKTGQHCTDETSRETAGHWVSLAQLVGTASSALQITGLETYPNATTGVTYEDHHGTTTEQTASRVQSIDFTIKGGSSVRPGTSHRLLGGSNYNYQIADAVGNGGYNLYINFTFTKADADANKEPSFEIEWR